MKGKVQKGSGEGIANMYVVLFDPADGTVLGETIAAPNGDFSVFHILPGTYSAAVFDLNPPKNGDVYEVTYLHNLTFSAGSTLNRIVIPSSSTITVSAAVLEGSGSPPWPAKVKAYDQYGIVVARARVDGAGQYVLKTLCPGDYSLQVEATGFRRGATSITVNEGDVLTEADLSVEWKGILADVEAAPVSPSFSLRPSYARVVLGPEPGGTHPSLGDFWKKLDVQNWFNWENSDVFNNQISNAITRFLEWVHNKPREESCDTPNLPFPPECHAGCPNEKCPPACCNGLKWQRASLLYRNWADMK